MRATVVIPTFNRAERLAELLRCLMTQGAQLARVVVCDDGSTDGTADVVRSFTEHLPVVYAHQEHRGFRAGQARNLGIARAVGEVIIFVDDDVLVAPDFVTRHLAAHADARGPRIAIGYRHRAFAPRERASAGNTARLHVSWDDYADSEADDRVADIGPEGGGIAAHPTPWFFVYSCNFSITRGPVTPTFDESFVGWGMEDIEFGYRLNKAGYEVVAAIGAKVLHIEDSHPRDPFRCEVRTIEPTYDSYVRNAIYFMDKYPDDKLLADRVRTDLRWYVHDEERGCWVKNGHANDIDQVLAHGRRQVHGTSDSAEDRP
jgi:glycosyltransferase involved in cell wall biosynthesis